MSLYNLSQDKFYYSDEIVNVFIEKMERTIAAKVKHHEAGLARAILSAPVASGILTHILENKFRRSASAVVREQPLDGRTVQTLLGHIVHQKFEQRAPSGDVYDDLLRFLSSEQEGRMEISYSKQQQKQKQKQQNKNQDSDTMEVFDKRNQMQIDAEMDNYFAYTLAAVTAPPGDRTKISLGLPLSIPIFKCAYTVHGVRRTIHIYPTVQFLYSHHVAPQYITKEVRDLVVHGESPTGFYAKFFDAIARARAAAEAEPAGLGGGGGGSSSSHPMRLEVEANFIKQSPQYSLAALEPGHYVIGMKDQFNVHDLPAHPLAPKVQYVADEAGLILYDRGGTRKSVDTFGPYFIEQYIVMEVLSKQEVAQNVIDYYCNQKEKLERGVEAYSEAQGKGFICWRFIQEFRRPLQFTPRQTSR